MAKKPSKPRAAFSIGQIMDMVGDGIRELTSAPEGMPARIYQELSPWLMQLTRSGAGRWLPVLAQARPCNPPPGPSPAANVCANHAIGACAACGRMVCIHHSMVDQHGGICCYGCVAEIMHVKRASAAKPPGENVSDRQPPPPPPELIRVRVDRALEALGLRRGVKWLVVEARHKELMKKLHPDRKPPAERAQAEAAFKKVREAYQDLERFYKPEVEAA